MIIIMMMMMMMMMMMFASNNYLPLIHSGWKQMAKAR